VLMLRLTYLRKRSVYPIPGRTPFAGQGYTFALKSARKAPTVSKSVLFCNS
jgi:hypothetical protein